MERARYVSTDRDGRSRAGAEEVAWEVPTPERPEARLPGAPVAGASAALVLRDAEGLLDDLGERVFLAEAVEAPAPDADGPVVRVASARLVAETRWDGETAARFALECAEHALGDGPDVALPHGRTLRGVLADVRSALEQAARPSASLGWLGRFAALRRLRRDGAAVAELAMLAAKEDGDVGLDLVDDPAWTSLAASSEAVLACAEALWSLAHPRRAGREREGREGDERLPGDVVVEETPWGWVALGAERVPAHRPPARCAEQAAERARQAVADVGGEEAARAERAWQAERLAALLGERDPMPV